jgi:hypothetical protein
MSILLYAYKELTQCISEVERIEAKLNIDGSSSNTQELMKEINNVGGTAALGCNRRRDRLPGGRSLTIDDLSA